MSVEMTVVDRILSDTNSEDSTSRSEDSTSLSEDSTSRSEDSICMCNVPENLQKTYGKHTPQCYWYRCNEKGCDSLHEPGFNKCKNHI